jgi:predicted metal-binding membrane protein
MFIAGYILVWAYAGLVVYVLLHAGRDVLYYLGWYQNGAWARLALGVTLTLAGLYQFTPLKHRCRSPLAFLKHHWRNDCEDAAEMGLWHGLYCLGCCWALFGVMLAIPLTCRRDSHERIQLAAHAPSARLAIRSNRV